MPCLVLGEFVVVRDIVLFPQRSSDAFFHPLLLLFAHNLFLLVEDEVVKRNCGVTIAS